MIGKILRDIDKHESLKINDGKMIHSLQYRYKYKMRNR